MVGKWMYVNRSTGEESFDYDDAMIWFLFGDDVDIYLSVDNSRWIVDTSAQILLAAF